MPYTPPANHSPSSSATSSANVSRRSSFNDAKPPSTLHASAGPQPHPLPRSSAYLRRHRRGGSAPSAVLAGQPTPQATADGLDSLDPVGCQACDVGNGTTASVRQSPPPMTGDRRGMPTGAVISPPDSPPSSDDEDVRDSVRGRPLESTPELKQLKEAISQLPRPRRASSPNDDPDAAVLPGAGPSPATAAGVNGSVLAVQPLLPAASLDGLGHSFSTSTLDRLARPGAMAGGRSSSSHSGRRVSHVRSATEPSVSAGTSGVSSPAGSDDENELDPSRKPQMVRKKSGELVRPALRLGSRRRPSSMPGTPTFSKAVHFDSHLEHVRHFLQVDRPLAVSASSSPVDQYESESEYPFQYGSPARKPSPSFEWEIVLSNFPVDTPARKAQPVRLERVWLSADQKFLHGSVAVLNLAFAKSVVCRFTLDYWKTTSEIAAEYSAEVLPRTAAEGHDRFIFTIKLSDLANLESKTMYFCIRYSVGDQVYWDNNESRNFQLDFKKKALPAKGGKSGLQGSALPRSSRRQNPSLAPRPRSMPVSLDDFDHDGKGNVVFGQSLQDYLGESAPVLRLKSSQSATALPSDSLASRLVSPSGQAFANRYDFGASLTAAMLAAKDNLVNKYEDGLYMTSSGRKPSPPRAPAPATGVDAPAKAGATKPTVAVNTTQEPQTRAAPLAASDRDTRAIIADSGSHHGSGSIASKSYEEIVSKYCFYVPKQASHAKDGTLQIGQIDGSVGELVLQNHPSPPSTISSDGSPVQMGQLGRDMTHQQQSSSQSQSHHRLWFQAPERRSSDSTIRGLAHGSPAGSTNSSSRSASPATTPSLVDSFSPFSGSPASDYRFQHMSDRFPFNSTDAHSTTPIQG